MSQIKRARGFVFTLNNYSEEDFEKIREKTHSHSEWYIIGKEVGPKCGTPHLQGYVYFKNDKEYNLVNKEVGICKWFENPKYSIRIANGTKEQNYVYCSKSNNFITNIPISRKIERLLELERNKGIDDKTYLESFHNESVMRRKKLMDAMFEVYERHISEKHEDRYGMKHFDECVICEVDMPSLWH